MALIERAQAGDEAAKTRLILDNTPLVKSVIRRYKNKGVEYDDLYQLGCMGLVKAIAHFDRAYGVRFSTYAVPMIAGEVKRFLRDDGSIKVSRRIKAAASAIHAFADAYETEHGEAPSLALLSEKFGMDEGELVFVMDSNKMPVSLYERTDDGDGDARSLIERIASDETPDDVLDRLIVKNLIESLPEKERRLMILRFFRDKTQSEIAAVLGVSQVQVSRMESRILQRFRDRFSDTV